MLDQIEKGLFAPLNVVEQHDDRRLLFQELAERPGDLVRRGPFVAAEERTDRRRSRRVGGQRAELLHDLDDGPVGDAGAVGRAASTNDTPVYSSKRFRDEA